MKVSEALATRISCRAFLDTPVPEKTVRTILDLCRQAPSGGNLQPWTVYALAGESLAALVRDVRQKLEGDFPRGEKMEYRIYPDPLKEPFASRRFKCGEDLYGTINIPREDKGGRGRQFRRNFEFFGAPVGMFFFIDRTMGPPQWSDMGMFMQSVMLLAREHGLHTCAQEAWAHWPVTVAEHLNAPDELMLFAGMALGYMDKTAPINSLRTDRSGVGEFATLLGFEREAVHS